MPKKTAVLISGRKLADDILLDLKSKVANLNRRPGLAAILIGDDPASQLYVRNKKNACHKVGIDFHEYRLGGADHPRDTNQEVIAAINFLNNDPHVDAIIVQLPMPKNFDRQKIIDALSTAKDVDGLHSQNRQEFTAGNRAITPPLVRAVMEAINSTGENVEHKKVVIVAKSPTFAQPIAEELQHKGLVVETALPDKHMADAVATADVLISVVGKPNLITKKMIKKDAIVIDIGTTLDEKGEWSGDVAKDAVEVAAYFTPVPGGIGPLTVAMLLKNTYEMAVKNQA